VRLDSGPAELDRPVAGRPAQEVVDAISVESAWLADSAAGLSQTLAASWILVAVVVAASNSTKSLLSSVRVGEQRHRRRTFMSSRATRRSRRSSVRHGVDQPRAFVQSRPENVVAEISAGLVE